MSKRYLALVVALLALTGYAVAQEKVTLSAPVFQSAGAAEFRVASLYLNRQGEEIRAVFAEVTPGTATFVANGRTLTCRYDGEEALTLLTQLNKANLSTKSLERRVTENCQANGKLGAGTISGVPE